jgi:hypothetical protein
MFAISRGRIVYGGIISYLAINIAAFSIQGRFTDFWQLWLAPVLLIWYCRTQTTIRVC